MPLITSNLEAPHQHLQVWLELANGQPPGSTLRLSAPDLGIKWLRKRAQSRSGDSEQAADAVSFRLVLPDPVHNLLWAALLQPVRHQLVKDLGPCHADVRLAWSIPAAEHGGDLRVGRAEELRTGPFRLRILLCLGLCPVDGRSKGL
eukprot:CAMPEP_0114500332 /NCGR_PEP_ID=MMETSP0109-20121206/7905_1 /TAXON_ID=29199 /ORGANISM="Chlorarachnion reptans, Strain CCCM449" /LENGTH=146 /DNA_ID=CAMNT_0001677981 /DNA_START=148 /DNA_END=585 /DNA_ORIENTATION=-